MRISGIIIYMRSMKRLWDVVLSMWSGKTCRDTCPCLRPEFSRKGIGTKLVSACLDDAKYFDMKEVFALTYVPEFFATLVLR